MPTRAALRALSRGGFALEKAIAAHGGSAAVGARMGWLPPFRPRKPAGYWDSVENLRSELVAFVRQSGLRPGTMPTKTDMRRAGRQDLLRAVERRGGIYAVAQELLGASRPEAGGGGGGGGARQWRMPTRAGAAEWNAHLRAVAARNPELRGARLFEEAAASFADESPSSASSSSSSSSFVRVLSGRSRASDAVSDSWDSEGDDFDRGEEEDEQDEGADAAGLALLDSDEDLALASPSGGASASPDRSRRSPSPPPPPPPPPPAAAAAAAPKGKSGTRRPPSLRDEIDQW